MRNVPTIDSSSTLIPGREPGPPPSDAPLSEAPLSDAPLSEAPIYDLSYRDEFWASRAYEDLCDRIAIRALLPNTGGHLLDLGAGFGRLIDEYGHFERVTLVDASPTMIEAARARVGSSSRISVVQADATALPIESGSVDVVVSVRLMVHLGDPDAVFEEVSRVLRPGGLFVVEFPNRRHLLARLRYLARRQSWSPSGPEPHEYREGHFSHQPATVARALRRAGLVPVERRAVSMFRSARLKRVVPARLLARIEAPIQAPLGRLTPSPSVYIASRKRGLVAIVGTPSDSEPPVSPSDRAPGPPS